LSIQPGWPLIALMITVDFVKNLALIGHRKLARS